jgi:hypothetical protein
MNPIKATACPTRIFRMRSSLRSVGIIFATVGLLLWVAIWAQTFRGTRAVRTLDLVFPVLFTAISLVFAMRAHRTDFRISETKIELQTILRRRVLPVHVIRGRRIYLGRSESSDVWHLVLESGDSRYPSLDIEDLYDFDEPFRAWIHSLRDLDEIDKSRPKNPNFGMV